MSEEQLLKEYQSLRDHLAQSKQLMFGHYKLLQAEFERINALVQSLQYLQENKNKL